MRVYLIGPWLFEFSFYYQKKAALRSSPFLFFHNRIFAGTSLKRNLKNEIRNKMDKAMLLLVKRSARGVVVASKSGTGPSKANHSAHIELLDDRGEKVVEDAGKVVADGDPVGVNLVSDIIERWTEIKLAGLMK
ncbi:uncharacterized protein LOC141678553 [Apium graveolens]|uniref:uncharacterized protein LOC141678553 n=1 Tax=Apium graveolens TaxID=4045 RepID=UPI003D7B6B03